MLETHGSGKKRSWFWAGELQESDIWFEESKNLDQHRGGRGLRELFLCLDTSEVLWPQFHKQFSPAVSAKETFSSSPILTTCFIPCGPFLPCAGTSVCVATQWTQMGSWTRLKLLSVCPFPLTSVSPPGTRGEQSWLFWQQHQLIVFMKSLFQTAWYRQTRENAILLTAAKVGRQTSVSGYTATKYHYGLWWEKTLILLFPKEGEAYGGTSKLQNLRNAPEKGSKPPTALTVIACTCNLCLQARNHITSTVRKNTVLIIWHSYRYASETDCSTIQKP